ncbi:YciI family protein [Actinoplanes sp. N902-109]|uniref:YciI family protein n=1 Tax=Actinoplanes sp. (strain N902-109) TaxID=649831 RepID=UPI00032941F8|nr:YciI family protein [Actinoplanes sp. N902-109]AGL15301.1 YCII-like protein [Actinoplanes sp. N902-109]
MLYLLVVDYQPGAVTTPMEEWTPADIKAHMDYFDELNAELLKTGEYVGGHALTGPQLAKVVTSDGTGPVVTDGPLTGAERMPAGYQLVDVATEDRAIAIAARISAVPGPGGVPMQQPISVRRVISADDFATL